MSPRDGGAALEPCRRAAAMRGDVCSHAEAFVLCLVEPLGSEDGRHCEVVDMKQVSWRAGGCAAALLGVVTSSAGCADEESGFFIMGNVALDAPECVASADSGSTLLLTGLLDVALRPEYEATLLVGSQLTPRGDKANLRSETMIATITGAEVRLFRDTGELDTEFTVPASGVIRPEAGAEAGFGIVTATLIPAATGVALAAEINNSSEVRTRVARVVVFGTTIGGLDVETSPWSYVVRVCEGCLVDFPAGTLDPVAGCIPDAQGQAATSGCRFGQDEGVDCRTCTGSNDFCTFPGGLAP